ncbi:protein O-mannosyltransferase 1 [Leptopilina heterotoma]|uniref:protein O-mannosyltransferase 1 n=1 Tax=Leptopilina heterotoma TaxID=63436 RepID=UPI001CA965FD|nr:protein O-mannosyltransferase 1 [Leptopilina heterotoma]
MEVRRRKVKDPIGNFDFNAENSNEQIFSKAKNDLPVDTANKELKKRKTDGIVTNMTKNTNERISHNETLNNERKEQFVNTTSPIRLKVNFEIDLVAVILLISGLVTRLYHLEEPRNIVFDELHYGKYISLYMKKIFFFDSHPPLGKQLVSAAAYLANFDGQFKFDRIGNPYDEKVPLFALRLIPALCGSFLIPTAYYLSKEFGLRHWSCIITGLMLLFDNALLTQSRFILMESILIQFLLVGLLCVMKFRKVHDQPFTFAWWIWLILGTVNLTCALCVKYVGFYSLFLALVLIGRDYWNLLSRSEVSNIILWCQLFLRAAVLFIIMAVVYLGVFYVHLSVLTKAGPHDSAMTSAFQASLEGGLASITRGQPLEVTHGSQITLRHTYGRACWLHSHNQVYPLRYPDKRGSSHQQQVTCYSFKDVNNWWIVKRHDINDLVVTKPSEPIRHGDIIQLVHGITSRALNSHDIAAPMTPQSQEVSCYIDYNVSMSAQNLWRVEIANRDQAGNVWHAIQSQIRLIHINTECALKFSGRMLPEWGFNQHEVVADRIIEQSNAVWNVEEHRYTKSEDQKQRERELINAEMIPLKATSLSFWEKFLELQMKMLFDTDEVQNSHMYSSGPFEWPFLTRGIAYWVSTKSNAQIYLLGNIAIWYTGTIAVITYSGLLIFYLMRRKRLCYDISEAEWNKFANIGQVLLTGYLLHYLPFIFVERTLFLHHYLPAFVYKTLLTVGTIDHIYSLLRIHFKQKHFWFIFKIFAIFWIGFTVFVFRKFASLSYGITPLSAKEILKLRWSETWDFIIHKT